MAITKPYPHIYRHGPGTVIRPFEQGSKYMLILATANPGEQDWQAGITRFNTKFSPYYLTSLTKPSDFPQAYFLGLLRVT